jgi:hypothetical protein
MDIEEWMVECAIGKSLDYVEIMMTAAIANREDSGIAAAGLSLSLSFRP